MARSIQAAVKEAVDAAMAAGRIAESDRGTLKQFSAFKGESDAAGVQRYYLSAQLNEFIDIPGDDIVAEVDLAGSNSPLVLVVTRPETSIKHHQTLTQPNREVQISETKAASFLAGDIAARNLSQSRIMARMRARREAKSEICDFSTDYSI